MIKITGNPVGMTREAFVDHGIRLVNFGMTQDFAMDVMLNCFDGVSDG